MNVNAPTMTLPLLLVLGACPADDNPQTPMGEQTDTSAASDTSSSTQGQDTMTASTGVDGGDVTGDAEDSGDSDSDTGTGIDTGTGTDTGTDTDTEGGVEACAPAQAPQMLMDLGDRRLYLYEEVVSDQTFAQVAVDTPEQAQFIEYLEQADAAWPDVDVFDQISLLANQRDVFVNAGLDDGALWDALIDGSIGEVTPVVCLHSIFVDLQNQDFPLWEAPSEVAATVLTRDVDGQTQLRAYIQTQDAMLGVFNSEYIDAATDDINDGWDVLAHFHSHPYSPDNQFGDIAGTVIPSDPDIATYQSWAVTYDVQEAWISNGIHSLRLVAREFDSL